MAGKVHTDLSKEELIEAAVEFVMRRVAETLANPGDSMANEYVPVYAVASALEGSVLFGEETPPAQSHLREAVRKSLEAKVKRLLDEEAAKPDARILRFSSVYDRMLPRLDGTRRNLYGQQVAYTTPELFAKAQEAVRRRDQRSADATAEFTALLERARAAGLVDYNEPTYGGTSVVINLDQMRKLVALLENPREASVA